MFEFTLSDIHYRHSFSKPRRWVNYHVLRAGTIVSWLQRFLFDDHSYDPMSLLFNILHVLMPHLFVI